MDEDPITGESGVSILDKLFGLASGAVTTYGAIEQSKQRAKADMATAATARDVASGQALIADSRYKWIALAAIGLVLSLVILKKQRVA